jgi:hypothetical protein
LDTQVIPALEHNYGGYTVTKAPTTAAAGVLTGYCSHNVAHTDVVTLPALNETDYTYTLLTAAGCETNGEGRYVWNNTDYGDFSFDIAIPAHGHNYVNWTVVTEPTCTTAGLETGTCSHNPSHTMTRVIPARHTWGEWVVTTPATDTADGVKTRTCLHCDATETNIIYRATGGGNGSWSKGSLSDYVITSAGAYPEFEGVLVDGALLDESCYTKAAGSTIVTLKADYLETLEDGDHTVEILFANGASTYASLNVFTETGGGEDPKDKFPVWAIVLISVGGVLLLGGGGFALYWFVLRKKKKTE